MSRLRLRGVIKSRPGWLVVLAYATLAASPAAATSPRLNLAGAGPNLAGVAAPSVALALDAAAYQELSATDGAVVTDFPLPGGLRVDLELRAFEVTRPGARFIEGTSGGSRPFAPPPMRHYRGRIAGESGSLAYLWLRDGRIGGFVALAGVLVEDSSGLFLFGPRSPRFAEPASRELLATTYTPAPDAATPYCLDAPLADFGQDLDRARRFPVPAGLSSKTYMAATVAVDATSQYHNFFGNLADATAYAESLFGAVSTIYESEVKCLIEIGFLRIFTAEPDPYTNGGTSSTLLDNVRSEWTTNPAVKDEPRTVTHLLTRAVIGGMGYLDVLCSPSLGYSVSGLDADYVYPHAGYTWDADIVSHELGHNFASPHSHCYTPPMDHCYRIESGCYSGPVEPSVGTIMSYCHLVASKNLVFGQPVIDRIRPALEQAACIDIVPCSPILEVQGAPTTVQPAADVTINWSVVGRNCPDLTHTNVHWDTVSHAGGVPADYAHETPAQNGPSGPYAATFAAPDNEGTIYYVVQAQADPELVSPEGSVEVKDPVCHSLTVTAAPAQGGTTSVLTIPDCGSEFSDGTTATFKVTPAAGWAFTGWSGAATGMTNPRGVVLSADTAVTANLFLGKPATKPVLLAPAKGAKPLGTTQTLDWSDVAGATHYELQVKKNGPSGKLVLGAQPALSERIVSGLVKKTPYYWRVRACNALGCTAWPAYFNFKPL